LHVIQHIEKQRLRDIDRASCNARRHIAALQHHLDCGQMGVPPSSIVPRRDTAEALKLACMRRVGACAQR
jgi:hypothetical protein